MADLPSQENNLVKPILKTNEVDISSLISLKGFNGATGKMFTDGKNNIIKRIDKYETFKKEAYFKDSGLQEVVFLSQYKHPNIISVNNIYSAFDYFYIFMPYNKINLHSYILEKTLEERNSNANIIFSQIVSALYFLHKNKKIHGDIKPSNIAVGRKSLKTCLIDFGSICSFRPSKEYYKKCTYIFASPESLKEGYILDYSLDIWSLGITILYYYTKAYCFNNADNNKYDDVDIYFSKLIETNGASESFPITSITQKKIDPKLLIILKKMLLFDPKKRITIDDLYNDPYFTNKVEINTGQYMPLSLTSLNYFNKKTDISVRGNRINIIKWMYAFLKQKSIETSFCLAITIFDKYANCENTDLSSKTINLTSMCCVILASLLLEKTAISFTVAEEVLKVSPDCPKDLNVKMIAAKCNDIINSLSYKLYADTIDWIIYQKHGYVNYDVILDMYVKHEIIDANDDKYYSLYCKDMETKMV